MPLGLVHDFWEDCFPKPKLLLAANRLWANLFEYINKH